MPRMTKALIQARATSIAMKLVANRVKVERLDPSAGFITLAKFFTPGDKQAYTEAESDVGIIYDIPTSEPGSVWGTDGGSVGGHVGLTGGYMRLNKSGCNRTFLKALKATMAAAPTAYENLMAPEIPQ